MKLKQVQSKKLSLSLAALAVLGVSNLAAVETIDLQYGSNGTNVDTYFDIDANTQNLTLKNAYRNDDLIINSQLSEFSDGTSLTASDTYDSSKIKINMNLGEHTLIIENKYTDYQTGQGKEAYVTSPTITAKETTLKNMILQSIYGTSTINGNLTLQGDEGSIDNFEGGSIHSYGSRVFVAVDGTLPDGSIISGSMRVNGDLVADNTAFQFYGNTKADQFVVTGKATITNSGFTIARQNLGNLSFTNETLIRAEGGFVNDVIAESSGNGGGTSVQLLERYRDILTDDYSKFEAKFGEQLNSIATADVFIDDARIEESNVGIFNYTLSLSQDQKSLLMTSEVTDEIKKLSKQLLLKKAQLEIIKTEVESGNGDIRNDLNNPQSDIAQLNKQVVDDLTAQITNLNTLITQVQAVETQAGTTYNFSYNDELRKQIASVLNPNASEAEKELSAQITQKLDTLNGVSNDRRAIFIDNSNLQGIASALDSASNKTTANQIFDSILTSSANLNEAVSIALSGNNFATTLADLNTAATSQANSNSASSSINSTVNLSNDTAISSRLASLNNPFANLAYAKKLSKAYFANNTSDIRANYDLNDFSQSLWASVFGGLNIVDSENGGVYGISLGGDKKINDTALLGFYASFAKATLKDKSLKQESNNFQVGTYSSFAFTNDLELALKAYLGISPTKQESFYSTIGISNSKSDYTRFNAGINANLGKNFALNNDTFFIKPFLGTNYYYTHTPSYSEEGGLAKFVNSADNHSISLELGTEFRKYFNELTYFYTTAKLEQFVLNNSDDFSASFIGSNSGFNIQSADKLKTYSQLILGASTQFSDNFITSLSFAGKQILSGKVDNKNETYLSGNLEFRYRF